MIPRGFNYLLYAQCAVAAVAIYASIYVFGVGTTPFILAVVAVSLQTSPSQTSGISGLQTNTKPGWAAFCTRHVFLRDPVAARILSRVHCPRLARRLRRCLGWCVILLHPARRARREPPGTHMAEGRNGAAAASNMGESRMRHVRRECVCHIQLGQGARWLTPRQLH